MAEADFLKVAGFKQKMATKIKESIRTQVEKAPMAELMHASNLFGRGFGTKKLQLILTNVPSILIDAVQTKEEKVKRVASVEGMAKKTAEQFVSQIPVFLAFLNETQLTNKLQQQEQAEDATKNTSHPLYGKHYVMTGFRDKELMEKLAAVGAEQSSSVSKNTFVLLVKDLGEENSKTETAKKIGIPIMTPEEFRLKYAL